MACHSCPGCPGILGYFVGGLSTQQGSISAVAPPGMQLPGCHWAGTFTLAGGANLYSVYPTPVGPPSSPKQGLSHVIEPTQSIVCLCRFSVGSFSRFSITLLRKKTFHAFLRGFVHRVCSAKLGPAQPFPDLRAEAHLCSVAPSLMHSWPLPEVLARWGAGSSGSWILKNCFSFESVSI